jgi:hypothetical protein
MALVPVGVTGLTTHLDTGAFWFAIGDGANVITTGLKGIVPAAFAAEVRQWTLAANEVGSIVLDVWKCPFADGPPVALDSIVGASPPAISAAQFANSDDLSGWVTDVALNDLFGIYVTSCSGIKGVTLMLGVDR